MTELEHLVLDRLKGHVGRLNAIGQAELAESLSVERRSLATVIKNLVEVHSIPVGSATARPSGYYLIVTPDEQLRSERQLKNRIISTARRLAHLRRTAPENVLGQLSLEVQGEESP